MFDDDAPATARADHLGANEGTGIEEAAQVSVIDGLVGGQIAVELRAALSRKTVSPVLERCSMPPLLMRQLVDARPIVSRWVQSAGRAHHAGLEGGRLQGVPPARWGCLPLGGHLSRGLLEVLSLPGDFRLRPRAILSRVRIPLIVDTRSRLIADSVPGDRGHPLQVS